MILNAVIGVYGGSVNSVLDQTEGEALTGTARTPPFSPGASGERRSRGATGARPGVSVRVLSSVNTACRYQRRQAASRSAQSAVSLGIFMS